MLLRLLDNLVPILNRPTVKVSQLRLYLWYSSNTKPGNDGIWTISLLIQQSHAPSVFPLGHTMVPDATVKAVETFFYWQNICDEMSMCLSESIVNGRDPKSYESMTGKRHRV